MKLSKFKPGWIAVGILLAGYLISAVRFTTLMNGGGSDEDGSQKVIRIAHWSLEPGFRESFQMVIDAYNNLPHVKEQNAKVIQEPIPERVYNQVMNVHLISGTAHDLAVKGRSELAKGNALAKFFAPLGSYTLEPNPYNAPEYQIPDLPGELSEFLATAPWRDTFVDGLQGGYDISLNEYYAIPLVTRGEIRLFYNLDLLERVKRFTLDALPSEPDWLDPVWRGPGAPEGYLPRESGVAWLESDEIPQTLGQLMFYCYAVEAYAAELGSDTLVPIAGSSYQANLVSRIYKQIFFSHFWEDIKFGYGNYTHPIEVIGGYTRGVWDMDSPPVRAYFELSRELANFYPTGFLGLDREQALRRFVLGDAAIFCSGGWDAGSILLGVEARDNPDDRFDVKFAPGPLPAEDERWHAYLPNRITEAGVNVSVPLAINKQTPNFDLALDFLRFASSHRMNEKFAHEAVWLPVVVGTEPPEELEPFIPMMEGLPNSISVDMEQDRMPSGIRNAWTSNEKLFIAGDISYEEYKRRVEEALQNPGIGIPRVWEFSFLRSMDGTRSSIRTAAVERFNAMLGSEDAGERERALMLKMLKGDEAVGLRKYWERLNPDEPFPDFY